MSHLYFVYSITYQKPDSIGSSLTTHEGLLLAPAYIGHTDGQVYFLEYNGDTVSSSASRKPSIPHPKLPSWEQPKQEGIFCNSPIDKIQSEIYKSIDFPIIDFSLIGVCQDINGFCKTAKTVAKFNHGASFEATHNWICDVLASVTSQKIYKPILEYKNEQAQNEQFSSKLTSSTNKSIFNNSSKLHHPISLV